MRYKRPAWPGLLGRSEGNRTGSPPAERQLLAFFFFFCEPASLKVMEGWEHVCVC